jgi:hypothetical protein
MHSSAAAEIDLPTIVPTSQGKFPALAIRLKCPITQLLLTRQCTYLLPAAAGKRYIINSVMITSNAERQRFVPGTSLNLNKRRE